MLEVLIKSQHENCGSEKIKWEKTPEQCLFLADLLPLGNQETSSLTHTKGVCEKHVLESADLKGKKFWNRRI
jgi:hypothetical protein